MWASLDLSKEKKLILLQRIKSWFFGHYKKNVCGSVSQFECWFCYDIFVGLNWWPSFGFQHHLACHGPLRLWRWGSKLFWNFLFTNEHYVLYQKTWIFGFIVWSSLMHSVYHCIQIYMLELSVLLQLCVSGLGSMGMKTDNSAGNFMCLQNIIFQNCFMIVCGQNQSMKGHLSLLNMRPEVCIILKPEDMSHCFPFIKT
jgi:hypothetical protein